MSFLALDSNSWQVRDLTVLLSSYIVWCVFLRSARRVRETFLCPSARSHAGRRSIHENVFIGLREIFDAWIFHS
jgi:hypothetical protein